MSHSSLGYKPKPAPARQAKSEATRNERVAASSAEANLTPLTCACGGGCPRCAAGSAPPTDNPARIRALGSPSMTMIGDGLERDAEAAADRVLAMPSAVSTSDGVLVRRPNPRALSTIPGGRPLPSASRAFFEPRFGHDLGHVRVHTGNDAAWRAHEVRACAYTLGADIILGRDQHLQGNAGGDRLLAHELAHVIQQTAPSSEAGTSPVVMRSATSVIARTIDEWLAGSVNISALTYTQLLGEIDELNQYIQRQTASSPDTVRVEESLALLRAEVDRREAVTGEQRPRRRSRRGRAAPASAEPLPARYPRILIERTSVGYDSTTEMRTEYDLIMQWLAREDIAANERQILVAERDSLAPQLRTDRERVVTERHAVRVRAALTPADENDAGALETLARIIQNISGEPGNDAVSYIYHQGERVAISSEQAEGLRRDLASELARAGRRAESGATYYWGRYQSQLSINRDSPIIAGISGWLANVEDPSDELVTRYHWIRSRIRTMQAHIAAGRMVEAAAIVPSVERDGQEIRALARAFYEGHIEGAEAAESGLTFTRDAAFIVAGSLAAVVAAPVVAGVVGVGGLGLPGVYAAGATTLGTGLVVGGGMAGVRGGSAAVGTGFAGGSLDEVTEAFTNEGIRGFREGFLSGAGAGATRVLAPMLGIGASVGYQAARRIAAEAIVNSTTAMVDVLARGGTVEDAIRAGTRSALLSVPGALVGGMDSPVARFFVGPLTAGASAYAGARADGVPPDEALASAGVAVATSLAIARSSHASDADAALVERGRSMGASTRSTAAHITRRLASGTAAVLIGTADVLPPVRSGYGGTSVVMDMGTSPAVGSASARATPPAHADVAGDAAAPTSTTASPSSAVVDSSPAAATTGATDAVAPTTHAASITAVADDFNIDAAIAPGAPASVSDITEIERTGSSRSSSIRSLGGIVLSVGQRVAAIALHGQRFSPTLRNAWNATRNPRELAEIQTIRNHVAAGRLDEAKGLARAAFDRHRTRFWRHVRGNSQMRAAFEDAGMVFPPGQGAPVYRDPTTGEAVDRMTLEHSTRLADDPTLALEPDNLQTVLGDENSYALERIRRLDPFQ